MKHILTADQFTKDDLEKIFRMADKMKSLVKNKGGNRELENKIMTAIFYEPSTRTSSSFIAAMQRLGGGFVPITQGVQFSSVYKGESLEDTLKVLAGYSDVLVVRHPENGAIESVADKIDIPIISGGSGSLEHPTQALLDSFTIKEHFGTLDGLKIAFVGDLKNGRTVHSLTTILNLYETELIYVAPESLQWGDGEKFDKIEDVIDDVDVVYLTRIQKERFEDLNEYDALKDYYKITPDTMELAKEDMILMHPLPRIGEIDSAVDTDPRAYYFKQAENGLYTRMALLSILLNPRNELSPYKIIKHKL